MSAIFHISSGLCAILLKRLSSSLESTLPTPRASSYIYRNLLSLPNVETTLPDTMFTLPLNLALIFSPQSDDSSGTQQPSCNSIGRHKEDSGERSATKNQPMHRRSRSRNSSVYIQNEDNGARIPMRRRRARSLHS